jgi:hypothetical protein
MPSPWQWEPRTRRYRDTRSGRFLSPNAMTALRDQFRDAMAGEGQRLTGRMTDGQETVQDWTRAMRRTLKTTYIDLYCAGRGGRNAMTAADWGRCGRMLRDSYSYLEGFGKDLAAGNLSVPQAKARAALYFASATQAFEQGKSRAFGVTLPAYPADGSSECKAQDKCRWSLTETEDAVEATWLLGAAEHCPTCVTRSQLWNPLVIPR